MQIAKSCMGPSELRVTLPLALGLLMMAGAIRAAAQTADAADLCSSDVMRLCSEFAPDTDRIVTCLTSKRRQLTPRCREVLSSKPKITQRRERR
jgi:hypothetical protein